MGRYPEAKTVYEDFIAGHPDSEWLPRARELLSLANKKITSGKGELVVPPVAKVEPKDSSKPVDNKPAK